MDGGAWWAAVHGVAKSQIWLSDFTFTFHFHALEKEMATHSSVLAWRIPGMGEPGGLLSLGSHRVGHDWSDIAAAAASFSGDIFCNYRTLSKPRNWLAPLIQLTTELTQISPFFSHALSFCMSLCMCMHVQSLSHVQLFATLWTLAHQAPLSVRFSRQEYWSGLLCLPPGDLSNPGI